MRNVLQVDCGLRRKPFGVILSRLMPAESAVMRESELESSGIEDVFLCDSGRESISALKAKLLSLDPATPVVVVGAKFDTHALKKALLVRLQNDDRVVVLGRNGGMVVRDISDVDFFSRKPQFDACVIRADTLSVRFFGENEAGADTEEQAIPAHRDSAWGVPTSISVMIVTHNRTAIACSCLESLLKNLKFPEIHWVISDDRSQKGHITRLLWYMSQVGFDMAKVSVCRTTPKRFGMGAAMNIGLAAAFRHSDVVLRTEDDWYLPKPLDLDKYVPLVCQKDSAGILFGWTRQMPIKSETPGMRRLTSTPQKPHIFVNQVMLVHRRGQELVGKYLENCESRYVEDEVVKRFAQFTDYGRKPPFVYIDEDTAPYELNNGPFFVHVGAQSTLAHNYPNVPEENIRLIRETGAIVSKTPPVDIHTVHIGDRGYFGKIAVSLLSVQMNLDAGFRLVATVVCFGKHDEEDDRVFDRVRQAGAEVNIISLTDRMMKLCLGIEPSHRLAAAAPHTAAGAFGLGPLTAKLCLPWILPREVGKVLFLDGDITCKGDISSMFFTDMGDKHAAVVQDAWNVYDMEHSKSKYFNSGVMLLNLDACRKDRIVEKNLRLARQVKVLFPYDQNILNTVFGGNVVYLPLKYNCPVDYIVRTMRSREGFIAQVNRMYGTDYAISDDVVDDAALFHFCSRRKPWNPETNCMCSDIWNYYADMFGVLGSDY